MEYINADKYLQSKGINLSIELQDNDNKSAKVSRFIKEVTDWCYKYLIQRYMPIDLIDYDNLSKKRKELFQEGVIEQMEYILNNGWLNKDSGVQSQLGTIIDYSKIVLSPNAQTNFFLAGFCNI